MIETLINIVVICTGYGLIFWYGNWQTTLGILVLMVYRAYSDNSIRNRNMKVLYDEIKILKNKVEVLENKDKIE